MCLTPYIYMICCHIFVCTVAIFNSMKDFFNKVKSMFDYYKIVSYEQHRLSVHRNTTNKWNCKYLQFLR